MDSRIRPRKQVLHTFEKFLVFVQPWPPIPAVAVKEIPPKLSYSFPVIVDSNSSEDPLVNAVRHFVFPCRETITSIEHFAFVITTEDGRWKFGYCRQETMQEAAYQKCSVFISEFAYWNEIFYKALNYITGISKWATATTFFLKSFYQTKISRSSLEDSVINIRLDGFPTGFQCGYPTGDVLPSTLGDRCLSEFYNAFKPETMLIIFSSLLAERSIIVMSKKLSTLTSVVLACNMILNPFCWQHIFIPVLPKALTDYLEAPMPFIIGVPLTTWNSQVTNKRTSCLSRCVQVDADSDVVLSPYPEDLNSIPKDIVLFLKKDLKKSVQDNGLATTFLQMFVKLIGHYESAIVPSESGEKREKFDEDEFIRLTKAPHRSFLKSTILKSQMFHQFLEQRIASGGICSEVDIFHNAILKDKFTVEPNWLDPLRSIESRITSDIAAFPIAMDQFSTKLNTQMRQAIPFPSMRSLKHKQTETDSPNNRFDLPPPRPRPRPKPKPTISTQTQSCNPTLVTNWNNVLNDLKASPIRLNNSKSTHFKPATEPTNIDIVGIEMLVDHPISPPRPPRPTAQSRVQYQSAQIPRELPIQSSKADENLIEFETPVFSNARAFFEARSTRYPNPMLQDFTLYSKDFRSNELF